jgi:hypothetical protein
VPDVTACLCQFANRSVGVRTLKTSAKPASKATLNSFAEVALASLSEVDRNWRNICLDLKKGPILSQKSAILVVGLPLRPLEADSDYSFSHWTLVGV